MKAHPLRVALLALALAAASVALFAFYVNNLSESYSGTAAWPTLVKILAWVLLAGAVAAAGAAAVVMTRGLRR